MLLFGTALSIPAHMFGPVAEKNGGTDPRVTTTYKRSNGKRGIVSSWLSALPIKAIGYAPNKQEFTDAVAMRYEKKRHTYSLCLWRDKHYMETGQLHFNEAQLSERPEAQMMREFHRDVQIEPTLLPINENEFERKVNPSDQWCISPGKTLHSIGDLPSAPHVCCCCQLN